MLWISRCTYVKETACLEMIKVVTISYSTRERLQHSRSFRQRWTFTRDTYGIVCTMAYCEVSFVIFSFKLTFPHSPASMWSHSCNCPWIKHRNQLSCIYLISASNSPLYSRHSLDDTGLCDLLYHRIYINTRSLISTRVYLHAYIHTPNRGKSGESRFDSSN